MNLPIPIYVIDMTSGHDHLSIRNRGIGASEYQFYSFINELMNCGYVITCFNNTHHEYKQDRVTYKPYIQFCQPVNESDNMVADTTIPVIVQRFIPSINGPMWNKLVCHSNILVWMHDLPSISVFNFFMNPEDKQTFTITQIMDTIATVSSLQFVFVSNFAKQSFDVFFNKYGINCNNKMHVIYNILYEDEFKPSLELHNCYNPKHIVYASAWQKGIDHIVKVFDYMLKIDQELVLVLMTPGYDMNNFIEYQQNIIEKYPSNVIVHGSLCKSQYAKIICESAVVLAPPFGETFGCVFAESYYLGTPVVADEKSGAVKEIILNEHIVNYSNLSHTSNVIFNIMMKNKQELNIQLDSKFMLKHGLNEWKQLF